MKGKHLWRCVISKFLLPSDNRAGEWEGGRKRRQSFVWLAVNCCFNAILVSIKLLSTINSISRKFHYQAAFLKLKRVVKRTIIKCCWFPSELFMAGEREWERNGFAYWKSFLIKEVVLPSVLPLLVSMNVWRWREKKCGSLKCADFPPEIKAKLTRQFPEIFISRPVNHPSTKDCRNTEEKKKLFSL